MKPEELLSAYFDGELSPKERAAVESWLQINPEARQQVADYRRLSRMFETLSRTEVPQEFSTEVLQLAERRMLLPDATIAPRRRQIRVWWIAVPATAAAALVLALNLSNRNPEPARGMNLAERGSSRVEEVQFRGTGEDEPPADGTRDELAGRATAPDGGQMPDSTVGESVAKTGAAGDGAESATARAGAPATELETEQLVAAIVDDALLGAQDADAKDKPLSVVTIYVDGTGGLALLQKIFEDHRIVSGPAEKSDDASATTLGSVKPAASPASSRQALCVVVSEPEQLIRAFTQMIQERHSGVRIEAQEPIILADLDGDSQRRLNQAEAEVSQNLTKFAEQASRESAGSDSPGPAPQDVARDDRAKPASAATARKNDAKARSSRSAARRDAILTKRIERSGGGETSKSAFVRPPSDKPDDAEGDKDADEQPANEPESRQLAVPVPSGYKNTPRPNPSNNPRAANTQRATKAQEQIGSGDKAASEKSEAGDKSASPAQDLVRMLILVEPTPPAASAPPEK